jgi:hypothetical protein
MIALKMRYQSWDKEKCSLISENIEYTDNYIYIYKIEVTHVFVYSPKIRIT